MRIITWAFIIPCLSIFSSLNILYFLLPLDQQAQDFLYLSEIVKKETEHKATKLEKVKALTDWLGDNVKHVDEYPDWYDPSSTVRILEGGVGNCGIQTDNIIVLSRYIDVREFRRYEWDGYDATSEQHYLHTVAELNIDGNWGVFDPDMQRYVEDKNHVVSLSDLLEDPNLVKGTAFYPLIEATIRHPNLIKRIQVPTQYQTPMPLGMHSFKIYSIFGVYLTALSLYGILYSKYAVLLCVGITGLIFIFSKFIGLKL